MNDKLLYRVPDVAAFLSLSRTKVYELVRTGELPSVRIGGARRVRGEDLAHYVDSLVRVDAADAVGVR
jgi:excisionase family DNA binding protein